MVFSSCCVLRGGAEMCISFVSLLNYVVCLHLFCLSYRCTLASLDATSTFRIWSFDTTLKIIIIINTLLNTFFIQVTCGELHMNPNLPVRILKQDFI